MNVKTGAVHDVAGNPIVNEIASGLAIEELPDRMRPNISNPILHYGNGSLTVEATETLDLTPASLVDLSKIRFVLHDMVLSLSGASVTETDRVSLSVTLTPSQITTILRKSNIFGSWDATPYSFIDSSDPVYTAPVLDMLEGSVQDVGQNPNMVLNHSDITQFPDQVSPSILNASIDYGTGIITLTASESFSHSGINAGELQGQPSLMRMLMEIWTFLLVLKMATYIILKI